MYFAVISTVMFNCTLLYFLSAVKFVECTCNILSSMFLARQDYVPGELMLSPNRWRLRLHPC